MMIDFSPVILHVDMDAFFAAVETRNNPHLKGKPVVVGGALGGRGVVSTCSYEARKYGVHSGMPTGRAKQLCPQAIFISAGLKGYVYASACLQSIFERYTPMVQPISVDEAFLDISGTERKYNNPIDLVQEMKNEVWEKLHLTCSVGVSPTRYLAKLGSGLNKPNGLTILDHEKFREQFFPRPVDALWGIGESTKKSLAKKGILTVADLAKTDSKILKRIFGKNGDTLSVMSRGTDTGKVMRFDDLPHDKSMSHETTMRVDIQDPSLIRATILWLSDKVARRMRKKGYVGKTISVKIRSSDFKTITRANTIQRNTDRCDIIYDNALKLVPKEYGMKIKVRLLGVRVSHLKKIRNSRGERLHPEDNLQLELLEDVSEIQINKLTGAVDAIRDKYGENVIKYAGSMR
ncbi:MAG: DNA polymerase IV [candidate division Zixibacteria bacterium]|nr:DNA polymerase IV [candidate division Zixibacteria bacterium]